MEANTISPSAMKRKDRPLSGFFLELIRSRKGNDLLIVRRGDLILDHICEGRIRVAQKHERFDIQD